VHLLEDLEDADVRASARAASAEREPDLRRRGVGVEGAGWRRAGSVSPRGDRRRRQRRGRGRGGSSADAGGRKSGRAVAARRRGPSRARNACRVNLSHASRECQRTTVSGLRSRTSAPSGGGAIPYEAELASPTSSPISPTASRCGLFRGRSRSA
jgi:hypothetical protein